MPNTCWRSASRQAPAPVCGPDTDDAHPPQVRLTLGVCRWRPRPPHCPSRRGTSARAGSPRPCIQWAQVSNGSWVNPQVSAKESMCASYAARSSPSRSTDGEAFGPDRRAGRPRRARSPSGTSAGTAGSLPARKPPGGRCPSRAPNPRTLSRPRASARPAIASSSGLICPGSGPSNVEPRRLAVRNDVCVADQPALGLCDETLSGKSTSGARPVLRAALPESCRRCRTAGGNARSTPPPPPRPRPSRMSDQDRAHCGTSSSAVSGSAERSGSSRSGSGSACSPSRLTQIVRSPSSLPGATSWKRLAATWT